MVGGYYGEGVLRHIAQRECVCDGSVLVSRSNGCVASRWRFIMGVALRARIGALNSICIIGPLL